MASLLLRPSDPQPAVVEALAGSPLLGALDPEDLAVLAPYFSLETHAPGAVLISEGARDRDMFVIVSGEAMRRRGALDLQPVRHGDICGEFGLLAARPRLASVVASSEVVAARLSVDSLDAMAHEAPAVALRMVRAIVGGIGIRLTDMTDNVGRLLRQRILAQRATLEVSVDGRKVDVGPGTAAGDLLPPAPPGYTTVAALVDRRAVSVASPIVSDCHVEALTTKHWEGRRILRESQSLLLLEAAHRMLPGLEIRAGQPVGVAQKMTIAGAADLDRERIALGLEAHMRALVETDVHLIEERWTVEEARAHFRRVGWHDTADLLWTWRGAAVPLASYGEVYTLGLGPLVPRAGLLSGFRVLPDEDGVLLVFGPGGCEPTADGGPADELVADVARSATRRVSEMTREHNRWLRTLGMSSVGEFNHACVRGNVPQLIRVAEGFQEKRIGQIADEISERGDVRIVCVAGPSSSGKTTFIRRLRVQLLVNGIDPVGLSLDDYYVDREQTPKDESGEYDYEALEALRLDLLADHLARLERGETVQTARYDFGTGRSDEDGGPTIALGRRQILILEGIHGLNPRLLEGRDGGGVYRIFLCPLSQLPFDRVRRVHACDLRLLRRVVRDRHQRGSNAAQIIARWPSVRRGERRHIFPYQGFADGVFDSSLIYEVSVLKVFAERYLLEVSSDDPSYTTAYRLLNLIDRFITIYPDHVPQTSLLREFIGGTGYEY